MPDSQSEPIPESKSVAGYWREMRNRAWRDSVKAFRYDNWTQIMLAFFVAFAIFLGLWNWGSPDGWRDEAIAKSIPLILAVISFPLVFVWKFICAPAELDGEKSSRIRSLESALIPKLQVSIAPEGGFGDLMYGNTVTSVSGRKQSTPTRGFWKYLQIYCRNTTSVTVEECEAFITNILYEPRSSAEVKQIVINAIPVPWILIGSREAMFRVSIPSKSHRTLIPISNVEGNVHFYTDHLPIHPTNYIHIFSQPGSYIITMMISSKNAAAIKFMFRIRTGSEPTVEMITEG
jgi:hypothetical protein